MKPLVIIHGWSDEASSFLPLAFALKQASGREVSSLFLGNYISLDDDVQMKDLVQALARAWQQEKLPQDSGSVDVIIHSTGGLIIRDWICSHYSERGLKAPVGNLVMLAPANFGSPLAHKGRAFYGRVLKGFKSRKRLQTGAHILRALEMASPYSWQLAERDRLVANPYSARGIRATVIVGNSGYRGISSLANEPGSDGTVYVATANMNCARIDVDFPAGDRQPRVKAIRPSRGETALLVMDGLNHSSITLSDSGNPANEQLLQNIVQALEISNEGDFRRWTETCEARSQAILAKYAASDDAYRHGYQNTVFRVRDDHGFHVRDYVIEFYHDAELGEDTLAELFNREAIQKVHTNKEDSAYRSFMIDCQALYRVIDQENEALRISLSAMPDLSQSDNLVGYCSFGNEDIGQMELDTRAIQEFFLPNRSLLVDITLARQQKDELFSIRSAEDFGE